MIRILTVMGLFTVFSVNVLCAGSPAMIDRHIFTPDNTANEDVMPPVSAPAGAALEKELSFTGVLITPKGKQAIITENTKTEPRKQKQILKEGDQVKGMTIKEIGPNYVLLAGKESNTRLNLYKGAKPRPAPIAEPVKADISQQIAQQGTPKTEAAPNLPASTPPQGTSKEKEVPSPFGGGPKPGEPVQNNPSTAKNPFTEILNNMPVNSNRGGGVQLPLNMPPGTGN
ncbi:MAG: hypothetical protein V1844_03545 [Pseudomonadota bacterium]